MTEYGIFNDESATYASEDAVESQFYSVEEAETALRERYGDDEDCYVHVCEEPEEEDEEDEEERDDEDE